MLEITQLVKMMHWHIEFLDQHFQDRGEILLIKNWCVGITNLRNEILIIFMVFYFIATFFSQAFLAPSEMAL